ncbi:MAG: Na(+)/H(+) antiporter subunit D, partial [Verrucomicrobiae bacterium]|nr:Na(+)/H(+) antiporter subunit D [Verrucomicrobiae bacterium]
MTAEWNPALIMIVGGLLVPLFRGVLRPVALLGVPVLSLLQLLRLPHGEFGQLAVFGLELTTLRLDELSFVWALIFHIAAILSMIYALHVKDTLQHVCGLIYAGSAIGAVLAGDFITLFIHWEITAVSSVYLIW